MAKPSPTRSPFGTLLRVLLAGSVIAGAVGFPSISAASALSQGPLGAFAVLKAAVVAAIGAGISVLCMRTVVREIWTAWVGLLGGVTPASLVAPRSQLVGHALAHLAAGALLVMSGLRHLATGGDAASATWAFFGLTLALAGLGLGLGGAVPRLWWAWRGGGVEQPDDTVSRHLGLFAWLALTALSLSSGLAETLPARLDPEGGVPLRRGQWERECVSTLAAVQDICPRERRYVLRVRSPERVRIEWWFPRSCEVVIADGDERRTFTGNDAFVRRDIVPERPITVTLVGLDAEGCRFQLRWRPDREHER